MATPFTTHTDTDAHPAWSPSGAHVAFRSDRGGNADIWIKPSGGGSAVPITTNPASETMPTWSPSGTLIACESDRSGNRDIWIIDAAASPVEVLYWGGLKAIYR